MRSIVNRVFLTAALPFVLLAAYTSYQALWFQYVAAQAAGTVIDVVGTPPSLVVAYRTHEGETLTTESAGSDFYADIAVDTPMTVLYDPEDPSSARVDHFIENWGVPLFLGGVCAVILLAFLFARRDRPASMNGNVVAYPFSVIGVALLLFAGYLLNKDRQLVTRGETALGTIVDFRESQARRPRTARNHPNSFVYFREPVISFTTRDGDPVRFVALSGSYPAGLNTGDRLEVLYLPERPAAAEIKGSPRLVGGAQIVAILGSVSLAVGGGRILVSRSHRRRVAAAARARGTARTP